MASETPAVIVSAIAREEERRWVGKLVDMPSAMAEIGYENPVLIGIGDAFIKAKAFATLAPTDIEAPVQRAV
jgi:uroporphyrin-III C-methyltransferase / precorrin-2 dehydrogenase / sirohydrochlorin ferrochelatase